MAKRPQRYSKPKRHTHRVGELVYFHAYTDPNQKDQYFFCKGYVMRQPLDESPVYKVAITSVDPKSVLCGERPDLASKLLGKYIARKPNQLTPEPSGLLAKMYEGHGWLDIDEKELKKIQSKIKRKKQETK